jgi:hypothetical protein
MAFHLRRTMQPDDIPPMPISTKPAKATRTLFNKVTPAERKSTPTPTDKMNIAAPYANVRSDSVAVGNDQCHFRRVDMLALFP